VSSRAARTSSNLQAARAAVSERARRYAAPTRKGPARKSGSGKSGPGQSGQRKPGQAKHGQGKQPSSAKKAAASTATTTTTATATAPAGGKAPRSTAVVLRRIRPASVLRVSVLFYLSLCLALFVAVVLLWMGANAIGLVGNVEGFMDEVGFTDFRLQPGPLLVGWGLISVIMVVTGSVANFLMAVLYNLIGDVVGGIKVVLTEDPETPKK
jgi:hypothetical protein